MTGKGHLYTKAFRRLTTEKLVRLSEQGALAKEVNIPDQQFPGRFLWCRSAGM